MNEAHQYHKNALRLLLMQREFRIRINLAKEDIEKIYSKLNLYDNWNKAKHRISIYEKCIDRLQERYENQIRKIVNAYQL